jgi:ketosteroid isomerase-like protein
LSGKNPSWSLPLGHDASEFSHGDYLALSILQRLMRILAYFNLGREKFFGIVTENHCRLPLQSVKLFDTEGVRNMKHLAIRLTISLITFALGLLSTNLLTPSRHVSNIAAEEAVWRINSQYEQAHLAGDVATLDRILTDDFTISGPWGETNKAERLALLANPGFRIRVFNIESGTVEVDGESATVSGRASITTERYNETRVSRAYRYVRNYEKRAGTWKLVSVVVRR